MLRLAIVEDDPVYRSEFKKYLSQYEKESGEKFEILEFSDGDEIVEEYKSDFDIILMDVEMRYMDGMSAAEEIRKVDSDVTIIFITNMPQYAIRGYRVDALDYILKPVAYYAFSQTITRALSRRKKRQKKYVVVSIHGGKQKIDAERIRYIEVMNHDLIFHTMDGNVTTKGTIRDVEQKLADETFFPCNKSFLINLAFVDGVQNNDVCLGNDVLPVSRAKKKGLMDALNAYMMKSGR